MKRRFDLIEACKTENYDCFKMQVEKIDFQNVNTTVINEALAFATERGLLYFIELLLNNIPQKIIKTKNNYDHRHPLYLGCKFGHLEIVKLLMKYYGYEIQALRIAVAYKRLDIVCFLIESSLDMDEHCIIESIWICLGQSISIEHYIIFQLIQKNFQEALVLIVQHQCNSTDAFIRYAIAQENIDIIKKLLQLKKHENLSDIFSFACVKGNVCHVEYLYTQFNKLTFSSRFLLEAVIHKRLNIVKWLFLTYGQICHNEACHVMTTVVLNHDIAIMQFLIENKCIFPERINLLKMACTQADYEMIALLYPYYNIYENTTYFERSPWQASLHNDVYKWLYTNYHIDLNKLSNVNTPNEHSTLGYCYKSGLLNVTQWLLKRGAKLSIDEIERFACKPLYCSIYRRDKCNVISEIVKLFIHNHHLCNVIANYLDNDL